MERRSRRQADRTALGARAETLVCERLLAEGFQILARNARVGRLELDVVAARGDLIVFCEVRARRDDRWVAPHHTVDARKAQRVRQAARGWLRAQQLRGRAVRLDVASVVIGPDGTARVDYFEGAL